MIEGPPAVTTKPTFVVVFLCLPLKEVGRQAVGEAHQHIEKPGVRGVRVQLLDRGARGGTGGGVAPLQEVLHVAERHIAAECQCRPLTGTRHTRHSADFP